MSDQPSSPLQEAQRLAARLQAQLQEQAPDSGDLKAGLAQLRSLLDQAAARGEGEDASALRERLNSVLDKSATFTSLMVHEIRKPMTSIRASQLTARSAASNASPPTGS